MCFLSSLASTQIQKPLGFDNPFADNALRDNGARIWKDSGSLDDHQRGLLTLELSDEREVSSTFFKPLYFECPGYSHLF